jgi:Flagellar transcriptional activator (FlhC)
MRSEASAIAGLAQRLDMLPVGPVPSARKLIPGLILGERLCWLYEVYREWVPEATLTLERFLLLVLELAEQKTLFLSRCECCNGFWVIDKLETRYRQCSACVSASRISRVKVATATAQEWIAEPAQQSLF